MANEVYKMQKRARAQYGTSKKIPPQVRDKIKELEQKNVYPQFDKVVKICKNKDFAHGLLWEICALANIASEADF